jgi:hypothetical protein
MIISLEQIYDAAESWCGEKRCPKRDAVSLVQITRNRGPLHLYGFHQTKIPVCADSTLFDIQLARTAIGLMEDLAAETNVDLRQAWIIPHCFSDTYLEEIASRFPNVYVRESKGNLSTADPFYSLEELGRSDAQLSSSFAMLTFADLKGGVGCLLLRFEM